jgi:hypothetical protein
LRSPRIDSIRDEFPIRDRYTVSGHVVGDETIVFAWCECAWPGDAAEMEVL